MTKNLVERVNVYATHAHNGDSPIRISLWIDGDKGDDRWFITVAMGRQLIRQLRAVIKEAENG